MFVSSLRVNDFRCFDRFDISFTRPRTLICGANNSGKSTVFDAVRWLLTGRCRGLDAAGRGVASLRRLEAPTQMLAVSGVVLHKGIERMVSREFDGYNVRLDVQGFAGSAGDQQTALCEWLGVSIDALLVILDGERLMVSNPGDARDLLLGLLGVKVPISETESITLDEADARLEKAIETRRVIKRQLQAIGAPVPEPKAPGDIDAIRTRISELGRERDQLMRDQAANESSTLTAVRGQIDEKQRRLTGLQAKIASIDPEGRSVELAGQQVAAANARLKRWDRDLFELGDVSKIETDATERREILVAHKPEHGCVLLQSVPCLTEAKAFMDAAEALVEGVKIQTEYRRLSDNRERTLAEIETLKKGVDTAKQEREGKTQLELDASLVEGEIEQLSIQLDGLATDGDAASAKLTQQIDALDGRVAQGRRVLEQNLALQRDQTMWKKDREKRQDLEKELERTEQQAEFYGPVGARVQALQTSIGTFEQLLNGCLTAFGFTVTVSVDPWGLLVNDLPMSSLSVSERLRVAVSLQLALSQASGLGFTLVDQVDLLLNGPRRTLTKLVLGAPLEQVLLVKATEPDAELPNVQGVQAVRL